jgi:ubiquinone/menaquinone biosynthesis C-methylase UbiE
MDKIINKTLNLYDLLNEDFTACSKDIKALAEILHKKGLKFTTYEGQFNSGWGKDNIWFNRKLWEMCSVISYTRLEPKHRILDCGGASSIFSFYLASLGCQVDTVDIDWRKAGIVQNANYVAKEMNWNMVNHEANMANLPFEDQTFDRIFSICVLEHLPYKDQIAAIKEMSRVLTKGGIIGLTFDYGPCASEEKFSDVNELNERIISTSQLSIYGNRDYLENSWFAEQYGKTWGTLFLTKDSNNTTNRLFCTYPQDRNYFKIFQDHVWNYYILGILRKFKIVGK